MNRYHRQIAFWGEKTQKMFGSKTVAIIGVGALGSVCAELLARAGIGKLILIDYDTVELSNLQRQSLYDEEDIGKAKTACAKEKLNKINSNVKVEISTKKFNDRTELECDLILDCTDNFETRFAINKLCKQKKISWVHAAVAGSMGSILAVTDTKVFDKVYGRIKDTLTCSDIGVLNTAVHMAASLQVNEAVKLLIGKKSGKGLIRFDVWKGKFEVVDV